MNQLLSVWAALDVRRKVIVVLATAIVFAAVLGLSRIATTPSMSLLYSGLDSRAAGDVIQALDQQSVAYDVRGNAIYVPSDMRDQLRLTMASQGLPDTISQGYELLDTLSGFGTTSQMFDAAYWRAKEGELARTIVATPGIRFARVHIATQGAQGLRSASPPSASVTVTSSSGAISAQQAEALRFLVASAVSGLLPENVSVIDSEIGLVTPQSDLDAGGAGGTSREVDLKTNVQRLVEARVGAGRAIVELSLETVTDREQITERRFDPESRVAISTESEERTEQSSETGTDGVTVASNLPDGDAASGGSGSESRNSETRERVNFEVSETRREIVRSPGAVKRVTVAVLVDGIRSTDASGNEVWVARSDEEMADLRELIASAVGFDEARGDVITLKSLQFEPPQELGTSAGGGFFAGPQFNLMTALQLAVLAIVALILGLFVIRPILTRSAAPALPELAPPEPVQDGAMPSLPASAPESELDDAAFLPGEMNVVTDFEAPSGDDDISALPALDLNPMSSSSPGERLRELIEERQTETVEVLRNWMEDRGEKA